MKTVLATVAVAFGSALLPFINIEAYLGGIGVAIKDVGVWQVSLAAAVGQTAGKVVLYYAADWAMSLPWIKRKTSSPKWQDQYEKWRARIDEHPGQTALLLFASASVGFPPLLIIAILAGHLHVRFWVFLTTVLTGRWIRFLVILGAADFVVHRL